MIVTPQPVSTSKSILVPFTFTFCAIGATLGWTWAEVLNSSPRAPPLCIFCMSLFVNTLDSDNRLVRTVFRLTCSLHSVHCSLHRVHCSLLPEQGNPLKFTSFRNIHSWICATQRLHARTSVTSYTPVNIYNFYSRLAHFNAL